MELDKSKVLQELYKLDNIVKDYWELQKEAALNLYSNILNEKNQLNIDKIIEIAEDANIADITKDALHISGTRIMEADAMTAITCTTVETNQVFAKKMRTF